MQIAPYSIGTGDRFGQQGQAQLSAVMRAQKELPAGQLAIVWNKSYREHSIVGTNPAAVRQEAAAAVQACDWKGQYFVDADHISLKTVDLFLPHADFYTLDVADFVGKAAAPEAAEAFVAGHRQFLGALPVAGLSAPVAVTEPMLRDVAAKYLLAVQEAGKLYRHIAAAKGAGNVVVEVSMDETDRPQTPAELFFILSMVAAEKIPAQTIAPKFTGRFNKGVEYVGDLGTFAREFEDDVVVIAAAVRRFGLPANLKLSVHSGSDKFALYPIIHRVIRKHGCGLHLKTAGTTWLEELAALAATGGEGLAIAKEVYRRALPRFDELCGPYATVIDVHRDRLPPAAEVDGWSAETFSAVLVHDQKNPLYNVEFRQFIHVAYKVAAELGDRYQAALRANAAAIGAKVAGNLYDRHLAPTFLGR